MTTELTEPVEASAEEAEGPQEVYRKAKVGELGMRLPVGVGPFDGSAARTLQLDFRDWSGKDDRKIGAMRQARPGQGDADLVEMILAEFVTKWGHHDFTRMSEDERRNVLTMAPSGDIFHAWTMLRIENLGPELQMTFACGNCQKDIVFETDAEEIEEKVPVSPTADLTEKIVTRKGFMYQGARRRETTIAPVLWKTYYGINSNVRTSVTDLKLMVIEGAVVGLEGVEGQIILPPTSVDTLTKYDIELLARRIEERQLGPELSLDFRCPHCDVRMIRPVSWEYDVFFSVRDTSA